MFDEPRQRGPRDNIPWGFLFFADRQTTVAGPPKGDGPWLLNPVLEIKITQVIPVSAANMKKRDAFICQWHGQAGLPERPPALFFGPFPLGTRYALNKMTRTGSSTGRSPSPKLAMGQEEPQGTSCPFFSHGRQRLEPLIETSI